MKNNRSCGNVFEDIACNYLTNNGFTIIERNYRPSKIGEIDIILIKNNSIYFVEVKGRNSLAFGTPAEAVNKRKINKITQVAKIYLQHCDINFQDINFMIIEILHQNNEYKINMIENAF